MNNSLNLFGEASGGDSFVSRHIGPREKDIGEMLKFLGFRTLDELTAAVVPENIRSREALALKKAQSEYELLESAKKIASKNEIYRSYIGMGYSDCITPPVILRNILENPGWYTQYTPYQAEISQGRLEALLNFQTMVMDLTGMQIANASMLDEGTAAAEAMTMAWGIKGRQTGATIFVSEFCHPQTIALVQSRAAPLGLRLIIGDHRKFNFGESVFATLVQYPCTDGSVFDYKSFIEKTHANGAMAIVAADILSLTLLTPPGEMGADIVVGNTQRFGVPMGYGGPHAAYFATKDEFKRQIPGRIIGVSKDVHGRNAFRLALQTREQHIRRDKATSNICTAQVLLAVIASMYAVYHGPEGLKQIAAKVHERADALARSLIQLGYTLGSEPFFDTIRVQLAGQSADAILAEASARKINLRRLDAKTFSISLDETVSEVDLGDLIEVFSKGAGKTGTLAAPQPAKISPAFARKSSYLTHPVFNTHRSETEMLRYIYRLQKKDLSLTTSMIPLGSCTMKLNATAEMIPVTWPGFSKLHPFVPIAQAKGYSELLSELEKMLEVITGFSKISLQPNAGSQGEYAGLLVIKKFHESRGRGKRDVCLIPQSAHGTNPASAVMAGMKVVVVQCDSNGNVDVSDLRAKAEEHRDDLSALMVTYPSTHGVFEEAIREICEIVHKNGGQVYMDGANMNAQIGLCRPGEFGPDVCHLNLHKTFCIPHGGGGPGMGPIGVREHLAKFLPGHPVIKTGGEQAIGPISAAPWGSASILPISWAYISMMGGDGLKLASQTAILNANYMAKKLAPHFPVLYRGKSSLVAHECIFDFRPLKASTGVDVEDVAKRLMDYGFHAPTISFPVAGTVMVEPTESESKEELDRFCEAMIAIRQEIVEIENGKADKKDNLLKNAPHTADTLVKTEWMHPYTRERAAFPLPWVRENKFWPAVGRIDNVLGDRNLVCACPSMDEYV